MNSAAFAPEETKLLNDLIKYLLSYNKKSEKSYYDIHIYTDGYCTCVDWVDVWYDDSASGEKFICINEQNQYIETELYNKETREHRKLSDLESDENVKINYIKEVPVSWENIK